MNTENKEWPKGQCLYGYDHHHAAQALPEGNHNRKLNQA
jgi:hypothetical protein